MMGINANSMNTLFGFGRSSSAGSSPFSALTASLSDYNMIRSGSYKKLMTSYFAKTDADAFRSAFNSSKVNNKSTATSKDSTETLSKVESSAKDLKDSASKLLQTGTKSVFNKVDAKDEDGNDIKAYDTDKIYKAVKSFVDDYNAMIQATDSSKTTAIQKSTINMINATSKYESSLNKIGITIDSDNYRLSIDEETFKGADMNRVKNLFNGTNSFAYNVKSQASMIEYRADNEASRANTYTHKGSYSSNYSSGSMWDSFY